MSVEQEQGECLSLTQEGLWFISQLYPEIPFYHVQQAYYIEGSLDFDILETAFTDLCERHYLLNCVLRTNEHVTQFFPIINTPLAINKFDLTEVPEAELKSQVTIKLNQLLYTPFNLSEERPLRIGLVQLENSKHLLILVIHHLVIDGWSLEILQRDLGAFYNARKTRLSADIPYLPVHYGDFSFWQKSSLTGDFLKNQLSFWRQELHELSATNPLPTDFYPLAETLDYKAGNYQQRLRGNLQTSLVQFNRVNASTMFMTCLAAFQIWLYRLSGQYDFAIATPVANRPLPAFENILGCCINTLLIRSDVRPDADFSSILEAVKKRIFRALDHQHLPLAKVVETLSFERSSDRLMPCQIMLAMQNYPSREEKWADLRVKPFHLPEHTVAFDLEIYIREDLEGFNLTWLYRNALWSETLIKFWAESFAFVFEQCLAQPALKIEQLDLFKANELNVWTCGHKNSINQKSVTQLFSQQADQTPDSIALIFDYQFMSYRELNQRSNQIAQYLLTQKLSQKRPIVLFLERSANLVVYLFGILKAGYCYAPLNPDNPPYLINRQLLDLQPVLIITQTRFLETIIEYQGQCLVIDQEDFTLSEFPDQQPELVSFTTCAYILFTSGSSGEPKGVMVSHLALQNLLQAIQSELYSPKQNSLCLNITPLTFDIAIIELFLPLISGASILMINAETAKNAQALKLLLQSWPIEFMQATPSSYQLLTLLDWRPSKRMTLFCGGEPLPRALAADLLEHGATLWNVYGPTETTVWSTAYKVLNTEANIPIGKPLLNTCVKVLDGYFKPVPAGIWGELYIGGAGVAKGYLNNKELTDEKFILFDDSTGQSERFYKTGDRVRWTKEGLLEFGGRYDKQIKLRGHRIELEAIELQLEELPGIQQALVRYVADQDEPRLVAYCIAEPNVASEQSIRHQLKQFLHEAMIPHRILFLTSWPLTPHGKLDEKSLLAYLHEKASSIPQESCASSTELQLIQIWTEMLKPGHSVSPNDDFFQLGGTSLAAIRVLTAVEKVFKCQIPLTSFFKWTTIADFAQFLDNFKFNETSIPAKEKTIQNMDSPLGLILYRQLLAISLGRSHPRLNPQSLIFQLSQPSKLPALYICGADQELLPHLTGFQLFGLHSGFGFMPLGSENIQNLAQHYVHEILQHQPDGPFLLAGYCLGAFVAFEIARQLKDRGKNVAHLFLIDQMIFKPYSEKIAFFLFQKNNALNEIQQPASTHHLNQFFPGGWTLDLIPGEHTSSISYHSAMVLAERISARIKPRKSTALTAEAYQLEWHMLGERPSENSVTYQLLLRNKSRIDWPAGQLAIGHHFQDQFGMLVNWAVNTIPIKKPVFQGQTIELNYQVLRPVDEEDVFVIFDLLDLGNSWLSLCNAVSSRLIIQSIKPKVSSKYSLDQMIMQAENNLPKMILVIQQALLNNPENSLELSLKLAQAFIRVGRLNRAKSVLLNLNTKYAIKNTQYHLMLATLYKENKEFSLALKHVHTLLELQPNNQQAKSVLGLVAAELGDHEKAVQSFNDLIEIYKEQTAPQSLISQVQTLKNILQKIKHPQTEFFAHWLITIDPFNPSHCLEYAKFEYRRNRLATARIMLTKALHIMPNHVLFLNEIAKITYEQQDFISAEAYYKELISVAPLKIQNYLALAYLHLHLQRETECIQVLERAKALKIDGSLVDHHTHRIMSEIKQRKINEEPKL